MKIRADFHNHLGNFPYRGDFNKVVDIVLRNLGTGGVLGVAKFNEDNRYEILVNQKEGYERIKKETFTYVPEKQTTILNCQEVVTDKGHMLVLGIKEGTNIKNEKYIPVKDVFKIVKDINGISIPTHIFSFEGMGEFLQGNLNYLEDIDGLEVHNGESGLYIPKISKRKANQKAQEFYFQVKDKYDLGAVVGSDGHSIREIGLCYTRIEQPSIESSEKLQETLRNSIREHKDFSLDRMCNLYFGALEHTLIAGPVTVFEKLRGRV